MLLKSGSNGIHGAFYEYNINNATESRTFFQLPTQKAPHLVDNDTGGWVSGPIIRDKLFYFAGYEGDYIRQGYTGTISVPTATDALRRFIGIYHSHLRSRYRQSGRYGQDAVSGKQNTRRTESARSPRS